MFAIITLPGDAITQITAASSEMFSDLSTLFLFLVGIAVALLVIGAIISWLKR